MCSLCAAKFHRKIPTNVYPEADDFHSESQVFNPLAVGRILKLFLDDLLIYRPQPFLLSE